MKIILAYSTVVLIWATTPLAIQWSGQVDWFLGISGRFFISATLCLPLIFWFSKTPFSLKWREMRIYLAAAIGMVGGMSGMYYAAQTMPSGWISLVFGLTPIMTGILAAILFKNLTLSPSKYFGMLVSFMGLTVIFYPNLNTTWSEFSLEQTPLIIGLSIALGAVFLHALSTLLVKKVNYGISSLHLVAGTAWISSLIYLIIDPSFLWNWPSLPSKSLWSIAYLGTFGSVLGFVLYYFLLKQIDAIRLGFITLITPVVALLLGHYFNEETLNLTIWLGAGLVIFGLVLYEFGSRFLNRTKHKTV